MNQRIINKLSTILNGLKLRITDNIQYYKKIEFVFKSGLKEYKGKVILREELFELFFNGENKKISVESFVCEILTFSKLYDALRIEYEERGTIILIEANSKDVKMKYLDQKAEDSANKESDNVSRSRNYYIRTDKAGKLLKEIGIIGEDGKIKNDMIRKYNQIDHFIELIDEMIKDLAKDNKKINVLDCGCGKSYLSFVLNYYLRDVLKIPCEFIGIDCSKDVIEASKAVAKNLNYYNMEFIRASIGEYKPSKNVHLLISLHACDTATDEAIAVGINNRVKKMVVVPCCHKEILNQIKYQPFESVTKHGILKARLADVLTEGIRGLFLEALGYKVSMLEYISPLDTPKNLMMRIEMQDSVIKNNFSKYNELKNILGINPSIEKLTHIL
jgi:hypothetical protein